MEDKVIDPSERIITSVALSGKSRKALLDLALVYSKRDSRKIKLGEMINRAIERGLPHLIEESGESSYAGTVYVGKFPTKKMLATLMKSAVSDAIDNMLKNEQ